MSTTVNDATAPTEWRRGEHVISTDPSRLDRALIHDFLSRSSYWAAGIPRAVVERALEHSLCFGLYAPAGQIGLARVVTDRATVAYLADVFVLDAYRGRGLSKWLMEIVVAHPALQGLRRFLLNTRDAHGLYERFGFTAPACPEWSMERFDPDVYRRPPSS
jgi:GNAT superfamily N-acetyltransferase